ncbi:MAG: hypothetical protein SLRJCFUN_001196 [Candidatus Fervidibacter sp.]|jgi:iron complex transport system substrate-binding protein
MFKVASFLPSATEIAFALGVGDWLVGVTDKCTFPPEAKEKPKIVLSALNTDGLSGAEIDRMVREHVRRGKSLCRVDTELLKTVKPDIILAQGLCDVCAASSPEVSEALRVVPDAKVLWLNPSTLDEVIADILRVAEALGIKEQGEKLAVSLKERLETVGRRARGVERRPRVWVAEWVDPPYCCGHWVPQMVEIAGGVEGLGGIGMAISPDKHFSRAPKTTKT